jgi:hypothetical protein
MSDDLVKAAVNAHNTIEAFYKWVDRVEEAGGTTSIEGIAVAHAMFKSLKSNRSRLDKLITEPLQSAIGAVAIRDSRT